MDGANPVGVAVAVAMALRCLHLVQALGWGVEG